MYVASDDNTVNDRFHIKQYFNTPCTIIDTNGQCEGVIIKFPSFYIKMYEDPHSYTYTVLWYYYGNWIPFKKETVGRDNIREYIECHNL